MGKSEFRERRPLSARLAFWQSGRSDASPAKMTRLPALPAPALFVGLASLLAAPAGAVPGGEIDTLQIGRYTCELPGDALGPRGQHVPEADFTVIFGSSYRVGTRTGTYLLTGDQVVMTSGPHDGERYHRLSDGFLRKQNPDGSDSDLRCVIANRNNTFVAEPAVRNSGTGAGATP